MGERLRLTLTRWTRASCQQRRFLKAELLLAAADVSSEGSTPDGSVKKSPCCQPVLPVQTQVVDPGPHWRPCWCRGVWLGAAGILGVIQWHAELLLGLVLLLIHLHGCEPCLWQTMRISGAQTRQICATFVDSAAHIHSRRSPLCMHTAQTEHSHHSYLGCSRGCPSDACSHFEGLEACAQNGQLASPGKLCLLLHLAQKQATMNHLGRIVSCTRASQVPYTESQQLMKHHS